jgi:RNA polymerase sigma factor (sigma-70 family)
VLSEDSDGSLLEAYVHKSDDQAFNELVRRYTPLVQSVCRGIVGDSQSTDDAVQETFVVLMQRAPSLNGDEPLGGWLRVAALGCARQQRRGKLRRQNREHQFAQMAENGETADTTDDERELVISALQILPVEQRRALILRYIEQRSEEEVARIVGCPQRTLHNRVMAGMTKLRGRLKAQGRLVEQGSLAVLLGSLAGTHHASPLMVPVAAHGSRLTWHWLTSHSAVVVGAVSLSVIGGVSWAVMHRPPASLPAPQPVAAEAAPASTPAAAAAAPAPAAPAPSPAVARRDDLPAPLQVPGIRQELKAIATLSDGGLMACGYDHWLSRWEAGLDQPASQWPYHGDGSCALAVAPDQELCAVGNEDGRILLWDLHSGQVVRFLSVHHDQVVALQFSPDGGRLASTSKDGSLVLWDAASGDVLQHLTPGTVWISGVAWSPDGRQLATVDDNGLGTIWDGHSGAVLVHLRGHRSALRAVLWEGDGVHLLTSGGDGTLRRWLAASGEQVSQWVIGDGMVTALAASPDGRLVASVQRDGSLKLWSLPDGTVVHQQRLPELLNSVAFSHDGATVVVAGTNGYLGWWKLSDLLSVHP